MPIDKQILERLQANDRTLTELDLNSQGLTTSDMQVLVKALSQNQTLTTLYVSNNRIGDQGAKALSQNQTLTTLYVSNNRIGDEGTKALSQNQTLTTLNIYNNQIGKEWQTALKQRIEANQALAKLTKHFAWGQDLSMGTLIRPPVGGLIRPVLWVNLASQKRFNFV